MRVPHRTIHRREISLKESEEELLMEMNFEELDETTRRYMLSEFEAEEASNNPYRSKYGGPACQDSHVR
jgi:hypothetical protein